MTINSTIKSIRGRRIWDSRGIPTVEAEVTLEDGSVGRGIAPAGASRGTEEATELRDGGNRLAGLDVSQALDIVNGIIGTALAGMDSSEQQDIDDRLLELDPTPTKTILGGNAIIAVSLATLNAAAASHRVPLWRYIAGDAMVSLPLPEIQIFGGGAHADRRIDIQDFMVMPLSAETFDQALQMTAEVYRIAGEIMSDEGKRTGVADEGGWWPNFDTNEEGLEMLVRTIEKAGFTPGEDLGISLDVAGSEFGKEGTYRLGLEGRTLDTDGFIELLGCWIEAYPIVSIEDPLAENDHEGMKQFTLAYGDRIQIVGDDYLVTNAGKIRDAISNGICNAALIKPNQSGTVSETLDAVNAAKSGGWGTIISARSGDTEDVTITHLAVGWNSGQLKVGSFARSERMAKWNEGLRIAEQMSSPVRYAGRNALYLNSA